MSTKKIPEGYDLVEEIECRLDSRGCITCGTGGAQHGDLLLHLRPTDPLKHLKIVERHVVEDCDRRVDSENRFSAKFPLNHGDVIIIAQPKMKYEAVVCTHCSNTGVIKENSITHPFGEACSCEYGDAVHKQEELERLKRFTKESNPKMTKPLIDNLIQELEAVADSYGGHLSHEGRAWSSCFACSVDSLIGRLRNGEFLLHK